MEIHDILRAADVTRWHIVRTIKDQSVAEHSFNVCMIARAIAKEANIADEDITKAALAHDLDEVLLGDIPTVIKERVRDGGVNINDLYQKVTGRTLTSNMQDVLRVSDRLEAYWWIKTNGLGEHAKLVARDCCVRYENTFTDEIDQQVMVAARIVERKIFCGTHTL